MIYDSLDHLDRYNGIQPNLMKGLRFLAETDFSTLSSDRIELDGTRLYAMMQSYETKVENTTPEAHRKYADIQYLVRGEELIGVAPLATMKEEVEARPDSDIWFYHGKTHPLPIGNGYFMVLFPEDVHAPCVAVDGQPAPVLKCVVKVRLDNC